MISIILFALAVLSYYVLWGFPNRRKGLPPGPFPWPVIGNILAVGRVPHVTLSKWTQIYGNVFMVKFFNKNMVVISDAKLAREAFNRVDLSGRPRIVSAEMFLEGDDAGTAKDSVVSAEGRRWAERRRFTVKHLRGFTKDGLYPLLVQEITGLVHWARTQVGKPVVFTSKISVATTNVLWILLCGERMLTNETLEREFTDSAENGMRSFENPLIVFCPTLAKMLGSLSGWAAFTKAAYTAHDIMRPSVHRRLEKYADLPTVDNPEDYLDHLIKEIKDTKDVSSSFYNAYSSIHTLVRDMLFAGSTTVTVSVQWAILYLTAFSECQRKLQEEIDRKVGRGSYITIEHFPSLLYAQAVVRETLRKSCIVPLGGPHRATEDLEFRGFTIHKDTMVSMNTYHIHHDPEIWGDPQNFRPDRFLTVNADGVEVLKNYDELVPFSVGRRQCVGEQFAKDEIFLFVTNLFKNFYIAFAPGVTPNLKGRTLTVVAPHVHQYILTNRSN